MRITGRWGTPKTEARPHLRPATESDRQCSRLVAGHVSRCVVLLLVAGVFTDSLPTTAGQPLVPSFDITQPPDHLF